MKSFCYYIASCSVVIGLWLHYNIFEHKLSNIDWGVFLVVFGFSMALLTFISQKSGSPLLNNSSVKENEN